VARPRKASDEEIYEAAFRIMGRVGPTEWTLADVAAEVGLTAGALVQRFGSKRQLQLDLIKLYAEGAPRMLAGLRRQHDSPLAAVRAWADQVACLRLDLTDPEMHAHFKRQAEAGRMFVRDAVADAARAGELPPDTDAEVVARLVETVVTGSLFTWATYREGAAREWVRKDLDAVLPRGR
jgi:AcrR family transcriptional regulator